MTDARLPLFADGVNITEKELLACQSLARALPEKRAKARANLAGHRASQIKGRGMEFAEVRQYQSGDDIRTIDWRVTARTGKTHTKLFVEERERPILLLIDLSHSLYFGSSLLLQSVQAAHLATTLGWNAILNGDRLGALIATEREHLELKPRSRQQGILQLISGLKSLHQKQVSHMSEQQADPGHMYRACQRLRRIAKPGSLIWIVTDGSNFDETCLAPLSDLKRHCDMGAFVVTDPLRQGTLALPRKFELPVREGNRERMLDRAGYDDWLLRQQNLQDNFIEMMQKLNVRTRYLDAAKKLSDQLGAMR